MTSSFILENIYSSAVVPCAQKHKGSKLFHRTHLAKPKIHCIATLLEVVESTLQINDCKSYDKEGISSWNTHEDVDFKKSDQQYADLSEREAW